MDRTITKSFVVAFLLSTIILGGCADSPKPENHNAPEKMGRDAQGSGDVQLSGVVLSYKKNAWRDNLGTHEELGDVIGVKLNGPKKYADVEILIIDDTHFFKKSHLSSVRTKIKFVLCPCGDAKVSLPSKQASKQNTYFVSALRDIEAIRE